MAYQIGSGATLACTFTNQAGAVADPGVVTFTLRQPDGTVTTYTYGIDSELTRTGVGIFTVDLVFTQSGRHRYRFAGSSSNASVGPGTLIVDTQRIPS